MSKTLKYFNADFDSIFQNEIKPLLPEAEKERSKHLFLIIIIGIIALVPLVPFYYSTDPYKITFFIFFLFWFFASFVICCIICKKYESYLKSAFSPKIAQMFDISAVCDRKGKLTRLYPSMNDNSSVQIDNSTIKSSNLFSEYNRRCDFDNFKGAFDYKIFKINEIHLEDEGYRRLDTIFKGILIEVKLLKTLNDTYNIKQKSEFLQYFPISTRLFIVAALAYIGFIIYSVYIFCEQDSFFSKIIYISTNASVIFFTTLLLIFIFIMIKSPLEKHLKAKKEQRTFEKYGDFYILNQNADELFNVISSNFFYSIENLKKHFNSKHIEAVFFEDKLLIAVHTYYNAFEISNIFKSVKSIKDFNPIIQQFRSILDIVDSIKKE